MNSNIIKLYAVSNKPARLIIGLMSGTSLDGLDIALCRFTGSGLQTQIELLHFTTIDYDTNFKEQVKSIFSKRNVDLEKVCLLNEWIGIQHATMINQCLKQWNIKNETIDLIASHGQTIYHAPKILHGQEAYGNATLQIGDGDHIAVHTGITTLSDFRQKNIAAGGEGAPLAVYGDYLIFGKQGEDRIMLNIGGIANFTYLPGSMDASKIFSSDVGTGNTLMDAYTQQHFTNQFYDKDASIAKQGTINKNLLAALKQNDFFEKPFPKTTGPELFNLEYLTTAQQKSNTQQLSTYDVMATLNRFTADMIVVALQKIITQNYVVYTSGGGMHNPLLMQNIQEQLPNIVFKTTDDLHINPNAKEAVLFAILANEAVSGGTTNFGSHIQNVSMGKISFAK
jgi:anhydro-N-acetylmuramic acid kinase